MPTENEDLETETLDETASGTEDRGNEKDRPLSPRELVLQQMEERLANERGEQLEPAPKGDDGSKAKAAAADSTAEETAEVAAQDPLADLVEIKEGKPGMTLEVNGRKEWYPLQNIRQAAMRSTAADEKFNQAAQLRRQAAEDLKAAEALKAAAPATATRTADVVVDDKTLDQVSTDLVQSLINDSPEAAAAKMKTTLVTTIQALAPKVNVSEVANLAAKQVTTQLGAKDRQQDLIEGLKQFHDQFPEMKEGTPLYAVADSMSDSIAAEHEDWSPSQVMLEAGRRAKAWAEGLSGAQTRENPEPTPTPATTTSNRMARKSNLVPLPKARTGVPAQSETLEQSSPQSFMAELRRARGQPAA